MLDAAQESDRITNGTGGHGETACWGKPAPRCDYSGTLAAQPVGIAVLDHPANFRYPTTWHVRAYGLMTANPFGISCFTNDRALDGSHTWQKGKVAAFRHRVVLHSGDPAAADLDRLWDLPLAE
jgi:hypothetical protein